MDDDPGLAGTGTGQDQERSFAVENRGPLGRVEIVEQFHGRLREVEFVTTGRERMRDRGDSRLYRKRLLPFNRKERVRRLSPHPVPVAGKIRPVFVTTA
ncbi:hypothetical protein GEO60473_28510 [Geobacter sp. 60473]|nr:hypothetical protein GEO60473_28510 [Geobacter sp. 60473]